MALDDRAPLRSRALQLGGPGRVDHDAGVRHGDRDRVHRARGPGDRDPRGGPCDREPRLHEGLRVDPALDPAPRRLGRPSPGAREGRALRHFQSEIFARLVWGLGAMAAERVFYGENSNGVGGDVMSVTAQTRRDGGAAAMGPQPFVATPKDDETEAEARGRALERLERIGLQIMNRISFGGADEPGSGARARCRIRPSAASPEQIIGQAYVVAHNLVTTNREAVDRIASVLMEKKEIFGDELMDLLDSSGIRIPELDYGDEAIWPAPFFELASAHARSRGSSRVVSESVHEPVIDAPMARRIDSKADDDCRATRRRTSDGLQASVPRSSTLGLALVLGLGLGALVVVLSDTDHTTQVVAQAWSDYPSRRLDERARRRDRSARHEPLPELPDGQQLVGRNRRSAARRLQPARGKHPGPAPRGGDPAGPPRRRRDREPRGRDHRHGERRPVRAVRLGRPVLHRHRAAVGGTPPPAPPGGARARPLHLQVPRRGQLRRSSSSRLRRVARSRRASLYLRRGELGAQLAKPLTETHLPEHARRRAALSRGDRDAEPSHAAPALPVRLHAEPGRRSGHAPRPGHAAP